MKVDETLHIWAHLSYCEHMPEITAPPRHTCTTSAGSPTCSACVADRKVELARRREYEDRRKFVADLEAEIDAKYRTALREGWFQ